MPVEYTGISDEHLAVRTRAGLFDVSHMGEIELAGPDALDAVQWVTSNDASTPGGRPDSVLRAHDRDGHLRRRPARVPHGTRPLPARRQRRQHHEGPRVDRGAACRRAAATSSVVNSSSRYALLALQGPASQAILQTLTGDRSLRDQVLLVRDRRGRGRSRDDLAHGLHRRGRLRNLRAAGAGRAAVDGRARRRHATRDSCRAASARATRCGSRRPCASAAATWTTQTTVLEAGLGWIVGWKKAEFLGADRLRDAEGAARSPASSSPFEMNDRAIARHGHAVVVDGTRGRRRHERHADAVSEEGDRLGHGARRDDARSARRSTSTSAGAGRAPKSWPSRSTSAPARRNRGAVMYPADLKYTTDHEWIRLEGGEATVGITDFAQRQLGDIVFVELPEVGRQVKQGEVFGTIESVKAVSELFSPVSGEVLAVNGDLGGASGGGQREAARGLDDPPAAERARRSRARCSMRRPTPRSRSSCGCRRDRFLPIPTHRPARRTTSPGMLEAVGASSLDALVDDIVPAGIRLTRAAGLPPAETEFEYHRAACARSPRRIASFAQLHRPRLLRHRHAGRHPAQRVREPGLVHALHAVSGRDRAGPPRVAPQFPDDGERADGDGGRQRVAARRGDGRGRGDDAAAPRPQAGAEATTFLVVGRACFRRCARSCSDARDAAGHHGALRGSRARRRSDRTCSACYVQSPDDRGEVRDLAPAHRARARRRRARRRRHRPAGAGARRRRPANAARTSSSATRSDSACRSATAARTRRSSPRAKRSSGRCRAGSSACRSTRAAAARTAWRCRRASSTSAARRRRRTSARRRRCSPTWRRSTPSITARTASARIAARVHDQAVRLGARRGRAGLAADEPRVLRHAALRARRGRRERGAARRGGARHQLPLSGGRRRSDLARRDGQRSRSRRHRRGVRRRRRQRRAPATDRRRATRTTLAGRARAGRSAFLTHPVFNAHHSETEMMRYIRALERKDLGLDTAMIPLGSCTMKLNAAAEMMPVTLAGVLAHPSVRAGRAGRGLSADLRRARGGARRDHRLSGGVAAAELRRAGRVRRPARRFARITARAAQAQRDVVLIPQSAHGTNPASAVDGRHARRGRRVRRPRQHRRGRSAREGGGSIATSCRA